MNSDFLLEVRELRTVFPTEKGEVCAIDGVTFGIRPGETVGIVGESGCGKSVTALSVMRLVSHGTGARLSGHMILSGRDLAKIPESEMRKVRGKEISMIFQEPMTSLNPVFTVGDQIGETIRLHSNVSRSHSIERAVEMMKAVGIPSPERRIHDYPHQLSGGMRQRVMIAMALSCDPKILIADEPTTALDVTIQAQILELLRDLQQRTGLAILLITHDLGIIAETAQRVLVMYAGKVVESGDVRQIFKHPRHPYTQGLLRSVPSLTQGKKGERLYAIPGMVPDPLKLPRGCRFQDRCSHVSDLCRQSEPEMRRIDSVESQSGGMHEVRCIKDIIYEK